VNRIDVVLAIFLALFALRGFGRGFSRELFALIGLVGGLAAAVTTYAQAAEMLPPDVPEIGRPALAFVGVFLGVYVAAKLAGLLVNRVLGIVLLSTLDRCVGALFGAVKGVALVTIALLVARNLAPPATLERVLGTSVLMRPLLQITAEAHDAATAGRLPDPVASPSAAGG